MSSFTAREKLIHSLHLPHCWSVFYRSDGCDVIAVVMCHVNAHFRFHILPTTYCAPVWCRSSHTKLVDIQLNSAMTTISGSIMSTPSPWLQALSNIAPAPIRRKSASIKAMDKIRQHPNLLVFDDVIAHPEVRLKSRSPIWSTKPPTDWSVYEAWKED